MTAPDVAELRKLAEAARTKAENRLRRAGNPDPNAEHLRSWLATVRVQVEPTKLLWLLDRIASLEANQRDPAERSFCRSGETVLGALNRMLDEANALPALEATQLDVDLLKRDRDEARMNAKQNLAQRDALAESLRTVRDVTADPESDSWEVASRALATLTNGDTKPENGR